MAYTPTTWNTGDTITATKLNKLENGVANAGSALIVTSSYVNNVQTMDKTAQEIYDALMSGTPVYYKWNYGVPTDYSSDTWLAPIIYMYTYGGAETVRIVINRPTRYKGSKGGVWSPFFPSVVTFATTSMNNYPTIHSITTVADSSVTVSNNFDY